MRNFIGSVVFIAAVLISINPSLSRADAYEDGMEAYKIGRYQDALGLWRPLAETGNVDASFNLGFIYEFGYGVAVDDAVAFSWYRRAADGGHEQAQRNVAWMYAHGKGVEQNRIESARWMRIAEAHTGESESAYDAQFKQAMFEQLCIELIDAQSRYDRQHDNFLSPQQLDASAQVS